MTRHIGGRMHRSRYADFYTILMTIDTQTLDPKRDPMGAAILDYLTTGRAKTLTVMSSMFDDDEMPVDYLFRTTDSMPPLELKALEMTRGTTLDVGAGAGCHALALQQRGVTVKAIDVSPLRGDPMRRRGIADVECINLFDPRLGGGFDTILMLINGTGIAGKMSGLGGLLRRVASLLAPGGQILIDSSDLSYVYQDEDGGMDIDLYGKYYGEVDYQMRYDRVEGLPFDWLYVDYPLLSAAAREAGIDCRLVAEGDHYDYLAQLSLERTNP